MAALGDAFFVQTFTTTLQRYEKTLVDNVLKTHPTLELFKSNAKSWTGRGLVIPVRAANLNATGYTDASGTHSTNASSDIMGSLVYEWADAIITPFHLKHREILQNSGPEQIVNLVEEYVKAAEADHQDFIVAEIHKLANTWTSGQVNSLDMLVSNAAYDAYAGTTVAGVDPTDPTKTYWQSTRIYDTASDIIAAFRTMTNTIFKESRKRPTHIICGFDVYEEFEAYIQSKGLVQLGGSSIDTRWSAIKFGDLEVRLDPDCQNDRAYFLYQPSLRFGYLAGEFMKTYPAVPLEGTLDTVVPIASTIALGLSERRANGVLIRGVDPTL